MKLKTSVLICAAMHLIGASSASATIGVSPDFRDYAIVAADDVVLPTYRVGNGDVFAAFALTLECSYGNHAPASWAALTGPDDPHGPARRPPAGGPGCTYRTRQLQGHNGPSGAIVRDAACPPR